jgi:hypothetical protein
MYSVGIDEDNNTFIRVGKDEGMATTLTLNYAGVIHMIRLLEATLPEHKEIDEHK